MNLDSCCPEANGSLDLSFNSFVWWFDFRSLLLEFFSNSSFFSLLIILQIKSSVSSEIWSKLLSIGLSDDFRFLLFPTVSYLFLSGWPGHVSRWTPIAFPGQESELSIFPCGKKWERERFTGYFLLLCDFSILKSKEEKKIPPGLGKCISGRLHFLPQVPDAKSWSFGTHFFSSVGLLFPSTYIVSTFFIVCMKKANTHFASPSSMHTSPPSCLMFGWEEAAKSTDSEEGQGIRFHSLSLRSTNENTTWGRKCTQNLYCTSFYPSDGNSSHLFGSRCSDNLSFWFHECKDRNWPAKTELHNQSIPRIPSFCYLVIRVCSGGQKMFPQVRTIVRLSGRFDDCLQMILLCF